ncbi:ribokinase [Aquiluna sp. Uisw_065]|uniref:ribokinase n=1 Tax=Aquiluna sp. Uisw_065 TaxID=3230967 RepID=UPI0039E7B1D0
MKQGISIAVVGSVNADYSVFMKKLPLPGETVLAFDSGRFAGGKGLNQAVAIHRAGGDVTFQFAVGDDDDGEFLTNFLSEQKVDFSRILDSGTATSKAFILVDQDGENQIAVVPGANYSPKLREQSFEEGPGLLVLQLEIGNENNLVVAALAKKAGWKVVLTPAPSSEFDPKLLEFVDIITLNETEVTQLVGATDFESAGAELSKLVGLVFVTRGAQGVSVFADGQFLGNVDAMAVVAIDATGAGDTFCGYALAGLAQGLTPLEAAELGTVAAGISVQSRGASNSIPSRHEVDSLMLKRQKG